MTPDEAVDVMAQRLGAIDWQRHGDKTWSKAALLKEYFRRAARWAAVYQCDAPSPFYDIAVCVDPSIRVAQGTLDEASRQVSAGGRTIARIVPYILRWAALRVTPGAEFPSDLEDPFEPLILLFERDGGFHTENGAVNLEYMSVSMRGWRNRADDPPMNIFAFDALDELDRAGSIAQFGHVVDRDQA